MLKKLKTITSEIKYSNPYWDYRFDVYSLPEGGNSEYHYVDSRGSTIVIPQSDENKYIMVRQYRYLNGKESLEFPGGGIKEGCEPADNAREELREETGYTAGKMVCLGEYNPFNGVTNEICRVYLATGLNQIGAKPDSSEEFEILELNENEIIRKIKRGEIWDGMTIAAWSLYYFQK